MTTPWDDRARQLEAREGPYARFAAWREWLEAVLDDTLPDDEPAVLETLSGLQQAYLFNAMDRLASGDFHNQEPKP